MQQTDVALAPKHLQQQAKTDGRRVKWLPWIVVSWLMIGPSLCASEDHKLRRSTVRECYNDQLKRYLLGHNVSQKDRTVIETYISHGAEVGGVDVSTLVEQQDCELLRWLIQQDQAVLNSATNKMALSKALSCHRPNMEMLELLLENGCQVPLGIDAPVRSFSRVTHPLYLALQHWHKAMAKGRTYIMAGTDPTKWEKIVGRILKSVRSDADIIVPCVRIKGDSLPHSPLRFAYDHNSPDMLRMLVKSIGEGNPSDDVLLHARKLASKELREASGAVEAYHPSPVLLALIDGLPAVVRGNYHAQGMSLLSEACQANQLTLVSTLIDRYGSRIEPNNIHPCKNAVLIAARCSSEEVFAKIWGEMQKLTEDEQSALCTTGGDAPTTLLIELAKGLYPLSLDMYRAVIAHYVELGGADINAQDVKGRTALMHAAMNRNVLLAQALLENSASMDLADRLGNHFLHYVVDAFSVDEFDELRGQVTDASLQALAKQRNYLGETVCMHTARNIISGAAWLQRLCGLLGPEAAVELNSCDHNGWNTLRHAIACNNAAIVSFLGDDSNRFHQLDLQQRSAMRAWQGSPQVYQTLIRHIPEVETHMDAHGESIFIHLIRTGALGKFGELLQKMSPDDRKALLGKRDAQGATLLHHAVIAGEPGFISAFLENGISVATIDSDGNTAAHLAAIKKNYPMLLKLVSCGSDISTVNKQGMSVTDILRGQGANQIAEDVAISYYICTQLKHTPHLCAAASLVTLFGFCVSRLIPQRDALNPA